MPRCGPGPEGRGHLTVSAGSLFTTTCSDSKPYVVEPLGFQASHRDSPGDPPHLLQPWATSSRHRPVRPQTLGMAASVILRKGIASHDTEAAHVRPRRPAVSYRPRLEALEDRLAPANLPPGFTENQLASELLRPTAMEFAPDGRLFVLPAGRRLRIIKNGSLLPDPFMTLSVNSSGERGLLGIAFDPDFATNQLPVHLLHDDEPAAAQPRQPLHRQRRCRASPAARSTSSTWTT